MSFIMNKKPEDILRIINNETRDQMKAALRFCFQNKVFDHTPIKQISYTSMSRQSKLN